MKPKTMCPFDDMAVIYHQQIKLCLVLARWNLLELVSTVNTSFSLIRILITSNSSLIKKLFFDSHRRNIENDLLQRVIEYDIIGYVT